MDIRSLLQAAVTSMEMDSNYGPHVEIADPFAPSNVPNAYLQAMQPRVRFTLNDGSLLTLAPYGDPGPTKWPLVKVGLAVAAAFTVIGVISSVRVVKNRRK